MWCCPVVPVKGDAGHPGCISMWPLLCPPHGTRVMLSGQQRLWPPQLLWQHPKRSQEFNFYLLSKQSKLLEEKPHFPFWMTSQPSMFTFPAQFTAPTESQNHRMFGIGKDLWGSSSPTPLPKQGHLQQAAQTGSRRVLNISREGESSTHAGQDA